MNKLFIVFVQAVCVGVIFGLWQENFEAGCFAFIVTSNLLLESEKHLRK